MVSSMKAVAPYLWELIWRRKEVNLVKDICRNRLRVLQIDTTGLTAVASDESDTD